MQKVSLLMNSNGVRPSRPEKLKVELHEHDGGIGFVLRHRGAGPGCFLLLWQIGWTVGCVFLIGQAIQKPSLTNFLFGLPFWSSWLVVAAILVWLWFGRESFVLLPDKALFVRSAWIRLSTREIPREEIVRFEQCRSSYQENHRYLYGIRMVTAGKPLQLAFRLDDQERDWLIDRLNQTLNPDEPFVNSGTEESPADDSSAKRLGSLITAARHIPILDAEPLAISPTPVKAPTDNRWRIESGVAAVWFTKRGQFSLGACLGLLFINAFWNGIVSVFVCVLWGLMPGQNAPPQGAGWWGMFFFLIPFEAIGLLMFAGLLACLLQPFYSVSWVFEENQIGRISEWPWFRRQRTWDTPERYQLVLRRRKRQRVLQQVKTQQPDNTTPFELAVVSKNNADLCTIEDVTSGEARWMADAILHARLSWLAD
ncbi:MAG: hypothetical protein KDA85_20925 [Planctomycetaceae bacterium]|nr:hypothetical protein [Planctomycetaceae bacterium]